MAKIKIMAVAGSLRVGSYNKKLLKTAVRGAEESGADVTVVDLKNFPMPPYDGDLEAAEGLPENAKKLKQLMIEQDGFIISSPEYNSSIPGTFKNVIDWVSRPEPTDKVTLPAFRGKVSAIMSASPGPLGGLRCLIHLRAILENIYVMVVPDQVTIASANEAFDENERLKDLQKEKKVLSLSANLVNILTKLKS